MTVAATSTTEACGRLLSVNVGLPKDVPWKDRTVHTGIYKEPVAGARMVRRLNIDGDGQGDLQGHGGEQRAVLVYQEESFRHWAKYLGRDDLRPGNFGENFTVDGLGDAKVCIGDRYRIGGAEFEVTQPRVTCFRVGMRLGEPEMAALLVSHRRPGFYLRVIQEGEVEAGDRIVKTRSGRHRLSVADVDALLYLPDRRAATLRQAVDIPALSPGWQQSFRDLLGPGAAAGPPIGVEPSWDGFRQMTVSRTVAETPTILSIYLRAEDEHRPESARPGQYLTLRVPGVDQPARVRSYSISSTPDRHTYRISVRREGQGAVSRYLHDHVRAGSPLQVAAPRGDFVLRDGDAPVLLMSAGVGATPVLAMLHALAERRASRPVWWVQVAREPDEQVFREEVQRLLAVLPDAHQITFFTRSDVQAPGIVSGRPTTDKLGKLGFPTGSDAYLCGPPAFTEDVTTSLLDLGLDAGAIHSELFGTLPPVNPGLIERATVPPHQPAGIPGQGPAVTFARSGLTVRWRATDASLLEMAEACDVPTRWSCRTGVCHTCMTPIIAGAITYRPNPLEPPADGQALVCCSRPDGDLVLDC
ncbi:MAG: MOSC domain-containing protein [Candidatus Dormibacteraceae bacterium]